MLSYAHATRPIIQEEKEMQSAAFAVQFDQGAVKAAIAETGAKQRDLLMVPIDKLTVVSGLNVRIHDVEYEAHIEEVKTSIIENGFYQHFPIPGFAGKEGDQTLIYVTGGFTRLEAAKRAIKEGAAIEALPVVLKPPGTSMLDLTYALDQDNTGSPLKPFERAIIAKRAAGYGDTEEMIAKRMGISVVYAKNLLFLMSLPNALQAQVITGRAAAGTVIDLARKLGSAEALKTFETPAGDGDTELDGETDPALSTERIPARVTPRAAAAASRGAGTPIIAKKTLFSAIDYAIALPTGGIEWLARWRKAEKDALAELAAYKPPRKNAKKVKIPKRGRKSSDNNAGRDPFDTEPAEPPL